MTREGNCFPEEGSPLLKIVGSAMVIVAATMFGFWKAFRYAERPRVLRHLVSGLQMLGTEISYGATPLPEALQRVGARLPTPAATLFLETAASLQQSEGKPASECWHSAVLQLQGTSLRDADRELLLHFGQTLGMSDREDQLKHIAHTSEALHVQEHHARDDQAKHERMWRYLGALTGIAIVILLY